MGIGQGIFIIYTHDILQEIHMLKVLMVHHIDFPGNYVGSGGEVLSAVPLLFSSFYTTLL